MRYFYVLICKMVFSASHVCPLSFLSTVSFFPSVLTHFSPPHLAVLPLRLCRQCPKVPGSIQPGGAWGPGDEPLMLAAILQEPARAGILRSHFPFWIVNVNCRALLRCIYALQMWLHCCGGRREGGGGGGMRVVTIGNVKHAGILLGID